MGIQAELQRRRLARRRFLHLAGGTVAASVFGPFGFTGAASAAGARSAVQAQATGAAGFGPLQADPKGRLALPRGFRYRELSNEGQKLSTGAVVPGRHDGMAAFAGPRGTVVLVRNHELAFEGEDDPTATPVVGSRPYNPDQWGGTTGVVVGPDRTELESFVTSSGQAVNCAGGASPWGTWLTCEETIYGTEPTEDGFRSALPHGYVFEVDPTDPENALSRTPIKEMGLFSHEAVGIDPDTGIVYLTEDGETEADPTDPRRDTGGSFLFRFLPTDLRRRPGALQNGGRLQALKAEQLPPSNDADLFDPGQRFGTVWVDVDPEGPTEDAAGQECLRFNRLEGAHFAGGALWFCDTNGGEQRLGQVFRYVPATNTLELFYEGTDSPGTPTVEDAGQDTTRLESPDNITVTPWGDVWVAEDGGGINRLVGFTPEGEHYVFAEHAVPYPFLEAEGLPASFRSEVAGPCFSPDGQTLFFNVQVPGVTFAVWGPFDRRSAARQRQMSFAAPPAALAPLISGEVAEAADRLRLGTLEAAAFHRLGVPIL